MTAMLPAQRYPLDVELERYVIAERLAAATRPRPLARVDMRYFGDPRHQHIWRAVELLEARSQPTDVVTVGRQLRAQDDLERVGGGGGDWGGWHYLFARVALTWHPLPLDHAVSNLRDIAIRRELLIACADITEAVATYGDPTALLAWARTRIP